MGESLIVRRPKIDSAVPSAPSGLFTSATGGTIAEYFEVDYTNNMLRKYRSHTFTSNGTFTVTAVGEANLDRNKVDYLIVAGGGSGATGSAVGAEVGSGGAGGYRSTVGRSGGNSGPQAKITVTQQNYPIVVGAGGAGWSFNAGQNGNNGSSSSAFGISTTGGGGGGRAGEAGKNGGSGGGAGRGGSTLLNGGANVGGEGFRGSVSGAGFSGAGPGGGAGGGGHMGIVSASYGAGTSVGGTGIPSTIRTGVPEYRAAGGAVSSNSGGLGGSGNGGSGGRLSSGGGGTGIVIIRYEIALN